MFYMCSAFGMKIKIQWFQPRLLYLRHIYHISAAEAVKWLRCKELPVKDKLHLALPSVKPLLSMYLVQCKPNQTSNKFLQVRFQRLCVFQWLIISCIQIQLNFPPTDQLYTIILLYFVGKYNSKSISTGVHCFGIEFLGRLFLISSHTDSLSYKTQCFISCISSS